MPGKTGWNVKKQIIPYLTSLQPEQVTQIAEQVRQRYIDREVKTYGETHKRGGSVRELAAEDFDRAAEQESGMFATNKIRKQFPDIGKAIWGIKETVGSETWASLDDIEWLESILPKTEKHCAQVEVDRYGKVKPMAGQASFDFDKKEPAPAIKATPTPPPAPEPENEPEPTSPLAIKLKRYLELQQKAVRQGLGERRTNLLK
jgi:hypothetical protein